MKGWVLATGLFVGVGLLVGCKARGPDDKAIVNEIQARLFQDRRLKLRDIRVESHQGAVTLSGLVKTKAEKTTVERLAREVKGVTAVADLLDLPGQKHDEASVTGEVIPPPPPPPPPSGGETGSGGESGAAGGESAGGSGGPTGGESTGGVSPSSTDPIDQYLARRPSPTRSSPMTGQGAIFQSYGQQYVIDPRLIVAISGAETSFATSKCHSTPVAGTHNAWNWFWCYGKGTCGSDVCINSPFDTWGSGIKTLSKFLRKSYLNKGYNTIPLIRSKYCIEGCEHWVPNVTRFYQEMNGDPADLSFHGFGS